MENGNLEKMLAWKTKRARRAALCFIASFFSLKEPVVGAGEQKGKKEKWGREFLIQTIPWFSARSKV